MRIRAAAILICILYINILAGCGIKTEKPAQNSSVQGKIKVMATVYPVYEFAKMIGNDKIELTMLVPGGVEPHDWEPTAKDLGRIQKADLFLYHGAGFEHWLKKVIDAGILKGIASQQVSENIPLLESEASCFKEEDLHDGQVHTDSHIWLDPVYAAVEVENIAKALSAADVANADYYRQNLEAVKSELFQLHQEYQAALAAVPRREIVTSHAAFGYLAKRYQLKQIPVMGLAPDSEPTPERMRQVIQLCREYKVKIIFTETLVSPRLAETIAQETGVQTMVLNPIEGLNANEKQDSGYFSYMRENLKNLQIAMGRDI